jgi:hypothetical protein
VGGELSLSSSSPTTTPAGTPGDRGTAPRVQGLPRVRGSRRPRPHSRSPGPGDVPAQPPRVDGDGERAARFGPAALPRAARPPSPRAALAAERLGWIRGGAVRLERSRPRTLDADAGVARGGGPMDGRRNLRSRSVALESVPIAARWEVVLSTEETRFCGDPRPPRIEHAHPSAPSSASSARARSS